MIGAQPRWMQLCAHSSIHFSSFFLVPFLTKQPPMSQPPVAVVPFVGMNYMDLVRACSREEKRVSANGQCHILSLSAVTGVSVTSLKTKMNKVLRENKASYVGMGIIEGMGGPAFIQYVKEYTASRPENESVPLEYWGNEYTSSAAAIALNAKVYVLRMLPDEVGCHISEYQTSIKVSTRTGQTGQKKSKTYLMQRNIENMTEAVACVSDSKAIVLRLEGSHFSPLVPAPPNHTMSNDVAASSSDIGGSNFQNAMDTSFHDDILNQSDDEDSVTSSSPTKSTATDADEYAAAIDADELKVRTNNHWKATNKRSFYWQFFLPLTMNGKEKQGTKNASTTCWMYCILCYSSRSLAASRMNRNKTKQDKGLFYYNPVQGASSLKNHCDKSHKKLYILLKSEDSEKSEAKSNSRKSESFFSPSAKSSVSGSVSNFF